MKVNDKVKYIKPMTDEIGLTFTIIEIDVKSNWCKIAANVDMNIKPTNTANISDLTLAESIPEGFTKQFAIYKEGHTTNGHIIIMSKTNEPYNTTAKISFYKSLGYTVII